ncbi:unnamed protein product [Jaminaea pallidilutea]
MVSNGMTPHETATAKHRLRVTRARHQTHLEPPSSSLWPLRVADFECYIDLTARQTPFTFSRSPITEMASTKKRSTAKRTPYHRFVTRETKRLKEENPEWTGKEAHLTAMKSWKTHEDNPNRESK